ncbi:hypothetical protein NF27_DT01860 [Candidatus Jidaibacter acanthamoeba]|uniref:Uncharacterized protein n=1 Tax=Candidatus Jidaibacter acanthamoebae TaxID=86105 RepID=A0A0C1MTJ2_9RICK|nr:hypothetical protein [Candidatus Jidaibacter acanthamoeba]KIE05412.1 hypothetical protein NF27_DT01860 [Candidatus Jidaibacter acanthamoeba]
MSATVERVFSKVPVESIKTLSTNDMAVVALTIQNFMDIMFEEIKKAGFLNLEFLEKSEMFLRAVTPSYLRKEFDTLLSVFNQIEQNFQETKFYYGLTALRQLCTHETDEAKVLLDIAGIKIADYAQINSSLIIFSTHLVENIIKFVQGMRKSNQHKNTPIDELKFKINSNFQYCLLNTVAEVNMTINKLKA